MLPCVCSVIDHTEMTSKFGKNKSGTRGVAELSLMFLPHLDVFCDLLVNQTHGNMESIGFI